MMRASLEGIPDVPLPEGFSWHWFQPGDENRWVEIQTAADHYNQISRQLFASEFAEPALLPQRQFYVLASDGRPIGTATAWFKDLEGKRIGRVHWVAVLPEFQRRGLGKALLSFCCRRLGELGHDRAMLSTSSARLPAIRLYLKFGFEPLKTTPEDDQTWREILAHLKRP